MEQPLYFLLHVSFLVLSCIHSLHMLLEVINFFLEVKYYIYFAIYL